VRHALGALDRTVLPAADPLLRFQRVHLNPTDGFVLSRVDGTCTAEEVIQLTPLPEAESMRSLLGLLSVGMVETVGVVPRARLPEPDPHQALRDEILAAYSARHTQTDAEVLGVLPGATPAEVRAAYFRLAKRFHPDAQHHPRLHDLGEEIQAVFFRITAAFEALNRAKAAPPSPPAPEPSRTPPQAAPPAPPAVPLDPPPAASAGELYRKAEADYGEGRYWEAVALLEEAVPLATSILKSKARLLLARICVKYPDRLKQAERELLAVVQEDPDQVEAYVLLGTLYKQQGLAARAAGHLRKALQLNPKHRTAQAELAELAPAEPDDDPSVLKRLFRR
jgi:hypothetical protein